jgi:hypothetical protein
VRFGEILPWNFFCFICAVIIFRAGYTAGIVLTGILFP